MTVHEDPIFGTPVIDEMAYVDEKAEVIGEVYIQKKVIVAAGASIRADEGAPFRIGKGANIQDQVTLHGLLNKYIDEDGKQYSIWIGSHSSIAHCALVHGPCRIGKKCFIGPQSQVWVSHLGRNIFVGAQSLVKFATIGRYSYIGDQAAVKGVVIPEGRYVADFQKVYDQETADNLPEVPHEIKEQALEFNREVVDLNKALVDLHKARRNMK